MRRSGALTGVVDVDVDQAVVTLVGDVRAAELPLLHSMLAAATTAAGGVTVDVSGVLELERSGVVALQQSATRLRVEGRELLVRGAGPALHDLLRSAGLFDPAGPVRPSAASAALMGALAARAGSGPTREVLDAALTLVVTMAQAVIGNADGVSITLPRDGQYGTFAASNDVVLAMDHDQYDTGQGPCLDAARHGEPFEIDDLAMERRWPAFVPRARARGIASILSSPVRDGGSAHGALNIYARTPGSFAGQETQWAHEFAAQASTVLTAAHEALPSEHLDAHLEQALASRTVIARAQGWMMHRDHIDADTAWSVLTGLSRQSSRPLRDVCEDLLKAVDVPATDLGTGTHAP